MYKVSFLGVSLASPLGAAAAGAGGVTAGVAGLAGSCLTGWFIAAGGGVTELQPTNRAGVSTNAQIKLDILLSLIVFPSVPNF